MIESADQSAYECRGARHALEKHAIDLLSVIAATDGVVGAEVDDAIPDLETLKLVKMWLGKMIVATKNAARHYKNLEQQAVGEAAGHKATHDVILKMVNVEAMKKKNIEAAIEKGDVIVDEDGELEAKPGTKGATGVRPGRTLKQQRLAEEAAEKQAEEGSSSGSRTTKKTPAKKRTPRKKTTKKVAKKKAVKKQ